MKRIPKTIYPEPNLSSLPKILEKIVLKQLLDYKGKSFDVFWSYQSDWRKIELENDKSKESDVNYWYGVPKGSILGAMFLMCLGAFSKIITDTAVV